MLPVKLHDSIVFLYFIPSLTYIGSHRPSIYGQKLAVHHLYLLTAFLHLDLHLPLCWCFSPPWSQTRKRKNQHGGWELGARALGRQGAQPAPQHFDVGAHSPEQGRWLQRLWIWPLGHSPSSLEPWRLSIKKKRVPRRCGLDCGIGSFWETWFGPFIHITHFQM